MPDFQSATHIVCKNCGTRWEVGDTRQMRYFRSASFSSYGSPAAIVAAAEEMIYCPSDVTGRLEKGSIALDSGQAAEDIRENPDGLDSEHAGSGGADVVHDSTRQTRK